MSSLTTRVVAALGLAGCLALLACAAWLAALERESPSRAEVVLDGGIPATFYLPGPGEGREAFLDPPPRGERPPAVVLMHGFASDRLGMAVLARRLALAGYAVLAFDASGHGLNRNPFARSFGRSNAFELEMGTAVDFLRADPRVDGERIVVMGHSMGAGASLDFATRDAGLDAAVLISGGWTLHGPHRPPNALFLYASADPGQVKERSRALAARLAGLDAVAVGQTYGEPRRGTGVRVAEIAGADHATVVWTRAAALEIVRWLDAVFGRAPSASVADDPRLRACALAALSTLALLPGLGLMLGRLAPRRPEPPPGRGASGLAALAVALFATMPLLSVDTPSAPLSIEVGDVVVGHLSLAGVALLVVAALRGGPALWPSRRALASALAPAALGLLAVQLLLIPVAAVLHRMTLTPERALVFAACTLALLPFSFAFQGLLRRGGPVRAGLQGVAGRVLVLTVMALGVRFGLLPFVVVLMLPALGLVFVLFELLAASIYASSRNVTLVALVDAAWLGLVVAASMPVRL